VELCATLFVDACGIDTIKKWLDLSIKRKSAIYYYNLRFSGLLNDLFDLVSKYMGAIYN
jgi:hypothetical protein